LRWASGFTLTQLTVEYWACHRAPLWMPHMQLGNYESATIMMRFNEAMDRGIGRISW
jgi:hypothetical protein